MPRSNKKGNQKWVPNNIAEYFFFDEYGFLSINEKKIRDCYEELTGTMSSIYLNMRGVYNTYAEKALNQDDIKRGIDFPQQMMQLIEMKGLEYFFDKDRVESDRQLKKTV